MHYAETAGIKTFNCSRPAPKFPTGVFPNGMIGDPARYERHLTLSGIYHLFPVSSAITCDSAVGHEDLNMYETDTHKNYRLTGRRTCANPLDGTVIDYNSIQPHMVPNLRKIDYLYAQDEWNFLPRLGTLTAGVTARQLLRFRRHHQSSSGAGVGRHSLDLDRQAALWSGLSVHLPRTRCNNQHQPGLPIGNPNLKPETIKTLEAAFSWQARKDTLVNLSIFRYDINDAIRPSSQTPHPQLVQPLKISARCTVAAWNWKRCGMLAAPCALTGNYSYQQFDRRSYQSRTLVTRPHQPYLLRSDWRYTSGWLSSVSESPHRPPQCLAPSAITRRKCRITPRWI